MRTTLGCLWVGLSFAACTPAPSPGDDGGPNAGDDGGGGGGGGGGDGGVWLPGCSEDNAAASVTARGGFHEQCVDAGAFPTAQCGDGSPLKLSWRDSPDGGTGLFLFFRGNGRCSDYVTCWGKDGKGGEGRTVAGFTNLERVSPPVSFAHVAHGLFNETEPSNALAGFAMVHVPDCTGDLGARDELAVLPRTSSAFVAAPASVRVYFRGARDVEAAVATARERYPSPSRIVLGGSGEGAEFALEALAKVDAAWPNVPLTVLYDGEAAVGDSALETKFRAAASSRPTARFITLSFVSDPVQAKTGSGFQGGLQAVLTGREAASPGNVRWFAPAPACHTVSMSPGLWLQYVSWTGGLRPAQPLTQPNPDLGLDGGANLEPWLSEALGGTGAFPSSFQSAGADFGAASLDCPLPNSLEP